ncbi:PREDICTED: transmembrane protein 45B-like [Branchiostoma belcheri]|uniref:Transmembrane protein 45B-like n=1 Tax=Branchiostoma belcheri TaxID=7741 RepID=A0A6P5AHN4_BRABE|nr:PREDICTED: transmembrane protein 45B-like [Branchiostoma belcheri]
MGNFPGHAIPGSFFLFFGLWWTIRYSVMWARRMGGRNTGSAAEVCCNNGPGRFLKRVPVEGLCKTMFGIAGIVEEQLVAHWTLIDPRTQQFHELDIWQHNTMYLFFALNGIFDILIAMRAPVPSGIDYVSLSLAYSVEGLLFFYHLHGRIGLDVRLHRLLVLAAGLCAAVSGLEAWKPGTLLLPMVRTACTLLQGTWFWQVGWILYPPFPGHEWDLESHENMMFVSMAFCWHILGILLFMSVVYTVVYHIYQAKEKQRGTELELGPLSSHMLQAHSDSELD